ncbi:MAG: AAA family ATPase [Candidatus Omnitrophica bacterium]|nr:AAA family ATPase [Candidatus Omnitrophota bacterium]
MYRQCSATPPAEVYTASTLSNTYETASKQLLIRPFNSIIISDMIIGLTGKNGSGKGEAAKFLKERGFHYYSLSDVLREEAQKANLPVTRDNLVKLGNELRSCHGPSVLAEKVFSRLDPEKNYVVDSVRHPSEVEVFRRRNDFFLAAIDASQEIRFERIKKREREKDPKTLEEFKALEQREASSTNSTDQQLDLAIQRADVVLKNESVLDELHEQVKRILIEFSKKKSRPDWDDYFLGIAKVVALRSNCIKRKVAAVIVKDKRIIATGYNGTPRGVKNCNEGGCPRCNSFGLSGTGLDECLCSHAEENAIVQSAYHGVNIKDTVLYTTFSPCLTCTKMIINAGIREVVFNVEYPLSDVSVKLLQEAGIKLRKHEVSA